MTRLSDRYLLGRLAVLESAVRTLVAARRATDPDPDDSFRGLYISDEQVDRLLATPPTPPQRAQDAELLEMVDKEADEAEAAGETIALRRLAADFGLTELDVELLLVALAPDLDPRFERLYGYLNDDVSRRRASVGLALELCGASLHSGPARARLSPSAPLLAGGLLVVEDDDRPLLGRALRVPDRVVAHLLGQDETDPAIAGLVLGTAPLESFSLAGLPEILRAGPVYLRERPGAAGIAAAAGALRAAGLAAVALDLRRIPGEADLPGLARAAAREARLLGGGLILVGVDALAERGSAPVRTFVDAPAPVLVVGRRAWDPEWSARPPLVVDAPTPALQQRARLWREALGDLGGDSLERTIAPYRLTPEQIQQAAAAARLQAEAQRRPLAPSDLQAGARTQHASQLERLARRIAPAVGWDDLVLPADLVAQLRELAARARHRDRVLDEWGMGTASRGRGLAGLFAGPSGTGKTLSAEVLAADLGLDLYVVDLSTVIDKYIGETEKNLDRVFEAADGVDAVLLFDEADALFGKRTEVGDSRDRYANVEVAYLLQRMEQFDGIAILTTNLRANLDEAFTRRLDAIIDFPEPEADDRRRLWDAHLPTTVPRGDDIDLDFLAESFRLSGGEIRNIALTAAFLAAEDERSVGMADLIRATEREYHKLGRLCLPSEFGPWTSLLTGA